MRKKAGGVRLVAVERADKTINAKQRRKGGAVGDCDGEVGMHQGRESSRATRMVWLLSIENHRMGSIQLLD
jgi:hypothetical protein